MNFYKLEKTEAFITSYYEQKGEFLSNWSALDPSYSGLPWEKLKNPAVSFSEKDEAGDLIYRAFYDLTKSSGAHFLYPDRPC